MNTSEIVQQRLQNQQVHQPGFEKPEELVQWMGAIQAQNYKASLWAMGVRMPESSGVTEADIEKAVAGKKIVRTWPMRGTLHFIAAEDIRWMLKLLTPRVIRGAAGRYRDLELDENTFNKSKEVLEDTLQGGRQLINNQLYNALEQAGISTGGQRGYHILSYLAQKGVICFGPPRGKQQTFTLLDEWIPSSVNLDRDDALSKLARRYIRSHGPATDYDFATWSGLTLKEVRTALEMNQKEFSRTEVDGSTFWFSETVAPAGNDSAVNFLPAFDEMLCGYKNRSAFLRSDHQKSIILRNGIFKPIIVSDGKVSGSWNRTLKKNKVFMEVSPFNELTKDTEKQLNVAVKKYSRFLELPVELTGFEQRH